MCSENVLCTVRHHRKRPDNNESTDLNINTIIDFTFIQFTSDNINTNLFQYMALLLPESGFVVGTVVSGSCTSIVEAVEASDQVQNTQLNIEYLERF